MQDDRLYARSHKDRVNLLIHLVAVPLFAISLLTMLAGILQKSPTLTTTAFAILAVSMGAQGVGHKREAERPESFRGPVDFFLRIFQEQFWRFPRLVASGQWLQAYRNAKQDIK